jgi:3',5'-cyclic AMP phosphodiesterase CpdA
MDHPFPKPICTAVPVKGLKQDFKILHVTDLHACAVSEEEAVAMPAYRLDYIRQRQALFAGGRPYPSEAALPVLFDYAAEIGADLILMTGDILDFPSETNLNLLKSCMESSSVPCLYITGNHDWSFADDYHTGNAASLYLPRMGELSGGDPHFAVYETENVAVCAVDSGLDRVTEGVVDAYTALARRARAEGKPFILSLHVPVHAETLVWDSFVVWGKEMAIGEGALGAWDAHTVRFYRAVAVDGDLCPDVVIAGHVHFDHEDTLPNGVTQYITDVACDGHCRVMTLTPAQ